MEKKKTTFFSPTKKWCLLSPSEIKPGERKIVVDSGASVHMISRKELNSAELVTVTTSRCPTTVMTVNGEVQTCEEVKILRIRHQCYRLESFAKITDTHMSGPVVKNHVS